MTRAPLPLVPARLVAPVATLLVLIAGSSVVPRAEELDEYALKAAYLYSFAKYIDWPAGRFDAADAPYRICVAGPDPFGSRLEQAVAGRRVRGRPFEIDRDAAEADFRRCHILFLSPQLGSRVEGLASQLGEASVVTVSERPGFAERGGIANFARTARGLAVELNVSAARERGLKVGAQLQQVVRIVGDE